MSTAELKIDIISKISNQEIEEDILKAIAELLREEPYILSEAQKKAIHEAREQVARGEIISAEEADKEIDQWLSEL